MEVRAISQGGQTNLEINKSNSIDKTVQISSNYSTEIYKNNDSISIKEKDISEKDIKGAIEKVNKFLEDNKTHAEYERHDKFNDLMIKIVDDKTGKVIQELPPKKILDMVAKMCELVGVLFDKKA